MSILFGRKHYVRKAIRPSELSVPVAADIKLFELHQHYVHFFFLPVSAYKSVWLARTVDNKLLEVEAGQDEELIKQYKTGAPWLPFAGTIVFMTALVVLLGGMIYKVLSERKHNRQVQQWALQETLDRERSKRERRVEEPTLEDYYLFKVSGPGTQRGFLRAKVIGNKDSAILFRLAPALSYDPGFDPTKIAALFEDSVLTSKPVWISKQLLIKMMESPQVPDFKTTGLEIGTLELDTIQMVHNQPDFKISTNGKEGAFINMTLKNEGTVFWITAMDAVKGVVESDRPLPDESPIPYNRTFGFRIRYKWDMDTVRFTMACVNKTKQVFRYRVTITDHEQSIGVKLLSE